MSKTSTPEHRKFCESLKPIDFERVQRDKKKFRKFYEETNLITYDIVDNYKIWIKKLQEEIKDLTKKIKSLENWNIYNYVDNCE